MSSLPSDLPKLPKWPFFLFDIILLATATLIAWTNPGRLNGVPLYAVLGCVILAAGLCVIPLVTEYVRSQDEAFDQRQRALEALSATVAASAEQIGIAAQGLCEVAETTQRALKQVDHLPQKLQERLSELQVRLDTSRDEEIEELERELATLRSSEGERLESASDKIHKVAGELAQVEAAASKHLLSVAEALGKAEHVADKAAGRLTQAADESASRVSAALTRTLASAQDSTKQALSVEQERVLQAIGHKIDATLGALEAQSSKAAVTLEAKIALLEAVVANLKAAVAEASRLPGSTAAIMLDAALAASAEAPAGISVEAGSGAIPEVHAEPSSAPKRARKTKREHAADEPALAAEPPQEVTPNPAVEEIVVSPERLETPSTAPVSAAAAEEIPAKTEAEAPSAPKDLEVPAQEPIVAAIVEPAAIPSVPSEESANEYSQESPEETSASTAISADGATRLIVTAYIGIGNRLYIRGEGPGLSWEKGMPLQFVSIGKWRWESAEATSPVKIKLLKNDQIECAGVGELTLVPGHQAEVTASF